MKTIRNKKEKGLNWNHYHHWKNKNKKLDLKDKTETHENYGKGAKKKYKKLKFERPNKKILYIKNKNQWLNWKTDKTLTKEKRIKIHKSNLKGLNLKYQ